MREPIERELLPKDGVVKEGLVEPKTLVDGVFQLLVVGCVDPKAGVVLNVLLPKAGVVLNVLLPKAGVVLKVVVGCVVLPNVLPPPNDGVVLNVVVGCVLLPKVLLPPNALLPPKVGVFTG